MYGRQHQRKIRRRFEEKLHPYLKNEKPPGLFRAEVFQYDFQYEFVFLLKCFFRQLLLLSQFLLLLQKLENLQLLTYCLFLEFYFNWFFSTFSRFEIRFFRISAQEPTVWNRKYITVIHLNGFVESCSCS
mgnify:CR=1 FL=1